MPFEKRLRDKYASDVRLVLVYELDGKHNPRSLIFDANYRIEWIFRCAVASLKEDVSVRMSVCPLAF